MLVKSRRKKIRNAEDVAYMMRAVLDAEDENDRMKEHFWCIGVGIDHRVSYIDLSALGLFERSQVGQRETFRKAIVEGVSGLIICHNHPCNTAYPSQDDVSVTKMLKEAGRILGIELIDHVIITNNRHEFFSFKKYGLLDA